MRETRFLAPTSPARRSETEAFRTDVLRGLALPRKELPCKHFYDARGSRLFEEICNLEEYYLSRTELRILEDHVGDITALMGAECLLIEPGSGNSLKTRILLDYLDDPVAYVPVDISRNALLEAAGSLAEHYPGLEILPVCADFTGEFRIPAPSRSPSHTSFFFPGSTLGNFHPPEARMFLRRLRTLLPSGTMLIGVDLKKDAETLERAYDDSRGITAEFNLNLLRRINRELGGDFRPDRFRHEARYNAVLGRIEMNLVSLEPQRARVGAAEFHFAEGERIRTEHSYKYGYEQFARLAAEAGLGLSRVWTDDGKRFGLYLCTT